MENFGWLNKPSKEIEGCIDNMFPTQDDKKKKEIFSFEEVLEMIGEYWIRKDYVTNEFNELFAIFDKKYNRCESRNRNAITKSDIRNVFNEYLDIPISDEDLEEFVKELDPHGEGSVSYDTLCLE